MAGMRRRMPESIMRAYQSEHENAKLNAREPAHQAAVVY